MTSPTHFRSTVRRGLVVALTSATVLALELAFIREIPAEVRAISYFTNLIFMAAFFGLGIGCMSERARSYAFLLPLGLGAVLAFVYLTRGLVIYDGTQAVHYWLEHDTPTGKARDLPLFPAALVAFVVSALPFIALGQRLAISMNTLPRLQAYGWDIFGSLAGTLAFVGASALRVPPWIWPPALMVIYSAFVLRGLWSRALHVVAGLSFLLLSQSEHPARWSPYYYVQHETETFGERVWVNSSFHQLATNLRPGVERLAHFRTYVQGKFGIPYVFYRSEHGGPPRNVLILGAGTGNDVNIALLNGAKRVVAVEIDPVILEIGRARNATAPYSDPRVTAVVDDARHFLNGTRERFDLIVFGTLDSQTLLSSQANLRLENYVYTREAFQSVSKRLAPDGLVAAYYSIFKPWLLGRLYRTICDSFPGHCQIIRTDPFLFDTVFVAGPKLQPRAPLPEAQRKQWQSALASTDDWPFLYLEAPGIATVYLQLIAALLGLIALVLVRLRASHGGIGDPSFFFLGMGFTLLESAAIVRLALLFGSTWVVNAVVFSAVLIMIFAGNWAVLRERAPSSQLSMIGLLASLAVGYAISPSDLVGLSVEWRVAASTALIGIPVFFASVYFSRAFARQASSGPALGLNLIGAMTGGLFEYVSMITGMRAVWLLVLAVYLCALLASGRFAAAAAGGSESEKDAARSKST